MSTPRVYDCFTFNDELVVLRFRLEVLAPVVDFFVLVEANRTHQGAAKRLVFEENAQSFGHWSEKLIHVVVRDMPDSADAWVLENFQRRAITRGLAGASPDDIALVSDADEIPKPEAVRRIRDMPLLRPVGLDVRTTYFFIDLREPRPAGSLRSMIPKACRVRDLADPHAVRDSRADLMLPAAGWHLAWLTTQVDPVRKLDSFAHTEYNTPWFKSPIHTERCRRLGVDLFGRFVLEPIPWDDLEEPLRAFGTAHPGLVHGPRGRWVSFLARCYRTNIWGAKYLPLSLIERHAIASFLAAGALRLASWPVRRARHGRPKHGG